MTSNTPVLRPYRDILPTVGQRAYVDPAATVIRSRSRVFFHGATKFTVHDNRGATEQSVFVQIENKGF